MQKFFFKDSDKKDIIAITSHVLMHFDGRQTDIILLHGVL